MDMTPEITQDDKDLDYVRGIRKELIENLITGEGGARMLPRDAKDVNTLAGVLSDMDRAALSNKRLAQEKEAQKNTNDNALLIAQMLSKISGLDLGGQEPNHTRETPSMPEGTMPDIIVEGMLDTRVSNETYADFAKKMQGRETDEK